MSSVARGAVLLALAAAHAQARPFQREPGPSIVAPTGGPSPPCTDRPQTCPDGKSGIPRSPYKQTWMMNLSTIIMPCNNTGFTDPSAGNRSTRTLCYNSSS